MPRRASAVVCAALATALVIGCRSKEPPEPAVATPSLTLSRNRVAIGSPLKLTYRFEVAPNARFDSDYWVFVHVLDPSGERLWVEDHLPPVATSSWKPGQKIEYTRTIFVPNYPYIGPAVVRLGLYNPPTGRRLVLNAEEVSRREYLVTKFELLPQSENVFLIYKDGWHPAEVAQNDPAIEWQWTKKSATISCQNPRKDSLFYMEYDARTDRFSPPQQITLRIGKEQIASFAAEAKNKQLLTFPISATQLGPNEMTELVIDVDRTFVPGGGDPRELGIRVYHAFLEPK